MINCDTRFKLVLALLLGLAAYGPIVVQTAQAPCDASSCLCAEGCPYPCKCMKSYGAYACLNSNPKQPTGCTKRMVNIKKQKKKISSKNQTLIKTVVLVSLTNLVLILLLFFFLVTHLGH